ncbi:MAG: hypothetical protein IPF52_09970 [Saprospiraceae bacterium]|nr:hypothetical protein [Saprospiraceae bacterium]
MKQTLDHNYKKDEAGSGSLTGPAIIINDKSLFYLKIPGLIINFRALKKAAISIIM